MTIVKCVHFDISDYVSHVKVLSPRDWFVSNWDWSWHSQLYVFFYDDYIINSIH